MIRFDERHPQQWATWGESMQTSADFNERIMKPALERAAVTCRNDMITAMVQQLQAFLEPNVTPDKKQLKRLAKASKHFRKMGWPKTSIADMPEVSKQAYDRVMSVLATGFNGAPP